jgi:hypothetical protein
VVDQRAGVYCVHAAAKVCTELRGAQLMEQRAPVQAVARADQVDGVAHQVQPDHLARLGQLPTARPERSPGAGSTVPRTGRAAPGTACRPGARSRRSPAPGRGRAGTGEPAWPG